MIHLNKVPFRRAYRPLVLVSRRVLVLRIVLWQHPDNLTTTHSHTHIQANKLYLIEVEFYYFYCTCSFLAATDIIADWKQSQSHTVIVMFGFCYWLSVIAALSHRCVAVQPRRAALTLILKARQCFRQVFDVRGAQCSSQRRSEMSGKPNKIGADWQLGGSHQPLRKLSFSINLVMRP